MQITTDFADNPNGNGLQLFYFNNSPIRIIIQENGEPLFVAIDVCQVLGLSNVGQAMTRLDDDEKNIIIINDGNKGNPNQSVINESGLYSLILTSRKSEAKTFKKWVTSEVLPQIRKTGSYVAKPKSTLDVLELSIKQLREQEDKLQALQSKQLETETRLRQLENQTSKSGKAYELLSLSEYCAKTGKPLPSAGTIWGTDDWAKAQIVWNANTAYARYFEARGYEALLIKGSGSLENIYLEKWDEFKFDERVWKSVYQKKV
jgi:prophage antirepressor-like protein